MIYLELFLSFLQIGLFSFGGGYAFADSTGVTVMDLNADRPMIERPSSNINRILRGKAILQSSYDDIGAR